MKIDICADLSYTKYSIPIVNPIQGGVANSKVESCSEGSCLLCLSQSPLRTSLICQEIDDDVVPSSCAKFQITLVKSKEEKRSTGTAATSAATGQASHLLYQEVTLLKRRDEFLFLLSFVTPLQFPPAQFL